ncbi:hypothetical protein HFN_1760 [Helicobacter fennelliae MRY12-0050]|uniref:Uncharacterized protein n=1 Tax=Helicobacter fennelliae MRY12-0050 TaxID=1325130 RepID=T1DV21_9HELI|nr:hypothetical protein HFN_1760 [Helicobacter fennelliae MRY12-0050]
MQPTKLKPAIAAIDIVFIFCVTLVIKHPFFENYLSKAKDVPKLKFNMKYYKNLQNLDSGWYCFIENDNK